MENHAEYSLAGWRVEGGDWHDVEAGDRMPEGKDWEEIDLVTVNLAPDSEDGFYRSANVFEGFDGAPGDFGEDEGFTLDDLVDELAEAYGFGAQ